MDGGDRYHEFDPPEALRPWVRKVWTYACPNPSRTVQRIAPDGCPELILDLGAPYEEADADGVFHLQPPALFAGQMTRPIAIRPTGPVEMVGLRFQPDGARDWLGRSLRTATDQRLDMTDRLRDLSPPAGDPEAQARQMIDWMAGQRRDDWSVDALVRAEVEAIHGDQPSLPRDASARRACSVAFSTGSASRRAPCVR